MSWRWVLFFALCASFLASFVDAGIKETDAQVLIIGGGPAGIQAAATLEEEGIENYLILVASDELRGYLKPVEIGGITVAPGFVWGYTPITDKLEELDVDYQETNYGSFVAYNSSGHDITEEFNATENAFYDVLYDELREDPIIEDIDQGFLPDLPQKAALARYWWIARTPQEKLAEWLNVDWCEGISGRHVSTIQTWRVTNSELFPDEYIITDDRTLAYPLLGDQEDVIEEDKVVYNAKAVHVNYSDDYVEVTTEGGETYIGNYTIITNTVGVIQNGRIAFSPPLPPWMAEQYCRYQMAINDAFFLKFDSKFWDDTEYIYLASEYAEYYPVFVNLEAEGLRPAGTNMLMGFLTGETAYRVEHLSDEEIIAEIADRITQTEDGVEVEANGITYSAKYAIVTSTVGVIQNGRLTFEPPLPYWKAEEFTRFQMGIRDVILLKFDQKFWDDTQFILHASDRRGYYPAFINMEADGFHPAGTNILMGFLTGDEAVRAEYLSDEKVQDEVMEVLRNMYGANIPNPTEFYFHRFATDETLYGTFANRPIGVNSQDAVRRLSAPFGRLYFAPEDATSEESITCPFGAFLSGQTSAFELAACMQNEECEEYEAVDDPCTEAQKPEKMRKKQP